MTRFWDERTDGRTDGVTALLDLLSPLATQVKIRTCIIEIKHLSCIYDYCAQHIVL